MVCSFAAGRLGQTKVQHLDSAFGRYLDITRFEISMDHLLVMGRRDRFGNLLTD
jgi:hypothetical protein